MIEQWEQITINEQELFERTVEKTKSLLLDLNKKQLLSGIDARGVRLPNYSSLSHINKRRKKGLQVINKDLKFNGDFHDRFRAVVDNSGIIIDSEDWKSLILESWWGDIFGLTDENFDIFLTTFKNIYREEFKLMIRDNVL